MKTMVKLITGILCGAFMMGSFSGSASAEPEKACIAYAEWSCAIAASNVVKAVLEEKMGCSCRLVSMGAEPMWLSTASGDVDGFVCAWLPSLHQHLYAKAEYNVIDLGPNLEGTRVGLVVPDYVAIDSIAELEAHAEEFNHRIIGIEPGAGIMHRTKQAMKDYQVEKLELVAGSGAAMTKVLGKKIEEQEWVVVTGWTPHWKFAKWDLKYLADPKNVYGGSEAIHTVVRNELKRDEPRLYRFLDKFHWKPEEIHQVMEMIRESGTPYKSAVSWVEKHPQTVETWLEAADYHED